jgi:hypothetical protein
MSSKINLEDVKAFTEQCIKYNDSNEFINFDLIKDFIEDYKLTNNTNEIDRTILFQLLIDLHINKNPIDEETRLNEARKLIYEFNKSNIYLYKMNIIDKLDKLNIEYISILTDKNQKIKIEGVYSSMGRSILYYCKISSRYHPESKDIICKRFYPETEINTDGSVEYLMLNIILSKDFIKYLNNNKIFSNIFTIGNFDEINDHYTRKDLEFIREFNKYKNHKYLIRNDINVCEHNNVVKINLCIKIVLNIKHYNI